MKKINSLLILVIGLAFYLQNNAQAPSITVVPNTSEFNRVISEHPYVVVFFHKPSVDQSFRNMVTFLSADPLYKASRLHFIFASTASYDIKQLAGSLDVDQFPGFVLFKRGKIIKDDDGSNAVIEGFMRRERLKHFIDDHFKEDLKRRAKKLQQVARVRARFQDDYYYSDPDPYVSVGFGYGYPYYGYYPYYRYGPGVGFSFGF